MSLNLSSSISVGNRSISPDQISSLSVEVLIRRIEANSACATTCPWPDPVDSHAVHGHGKLVVVTISKLTQWADSCITQY